MYFPSSYPIKGPPLDKACSSPSISTETFTCSTPEQLSEAYRTGNVPSEVQPWDPVEIRNTGTLIVFPSTKVSTESIGLKVNSPAGGKVSNTVITWVSLRF